MMVDKAEFVRLINARLHELGKLEEQAARKASRARLMGEAQLKVGDEFVALGAAKAYQAAIGLIAGL